VPTEAIEPPVGDEQAFADAVAVRMAQQVLVNHIGVGVDPVTACRFQALGLLPELGPRPLPASLPDILRDSSHSRRMSFGDGPLVFIREDKTISVIEIATLVADPNQAVRDASVEYLLQSQTCQRPWLTSKTLEVINHNRESCRAGAPELWRNAAVSVATEIRLDFLSQLAALRQSLAARYPEGLSEYFTKVLRPTSRVVAHLQPPTLSPTEQRADVEQCIAVQSKNGTIAEALGGYFDRCGHLPLAHGLDVAELIQRWRSENADIPFQWREFSLWAERLDSPYARYHACVAAFDYPELLQEEDWATIWNWVEELLRGKDARDELPGSVRWQLRFDLAAHYAHHLESLYPAQIGERIASFAWWLADLAACAMEINGRPARGLVRPLAHDSGLSLYAWTVSRSPVVGSLLWYATRNTRSVWGLSLIARLATRWRQLPLAQLPLQFRELLKRSIEGFVTATPLTRVNDAPCIYAFDENAGVPGFLDCEWIALSDAREYLLELIRVRRGLQKGDNLAAALNGLFELSEISRQLTLLVLHETLSSGNDADNAMASLLESTDSVVRILHELPEDLLRTFLEALAEFQLRPSPEWPVRIPHLIVYAMESTADEERMRLLYPHVMQMSICTGLASPIQRLLRSKWQLALSKATMTWRANLLEVAKASEPWVAARVRATSSVISRILGPPSSFDVSQAVRTESQPQE
jgi:hypothetical protein